MSNIYTRMSRNITLIKSNDGHSPQDAHKSVKNFGLLLESPLLRESREKSFASIQEQEDSSEEQDDIIFTEVKPAEFTKLKKSKTLSLEK